MNLRVLSLLLLSPSLVAQIYSNGPLQTGVVAGNAVSVLSNVAPEFHSIFGYGAQQAAGNWLADDFTVCNGPWVVDEIEVFGYQTGGTVPSATDLRLEIYSGGVPGVTGVPLVDAAGNSLPGIAVNLVTLPAAVGTTVGVTAFSNTFTNIYRTLPAVGLTRNIQSMKVTLSPALIIPAGTYWLRFGYTGPSFCPPITTPLMQVTGNGAQSTTAVPAFTTVTSGTALHPQGLPFKFYGTAGGPAGSITNLGGDCGTPLTLTVAGSPVTGGYVSASLTNLAGAGYFPFITTDTTNPGAGVPGVIFGCATCNLWFTPTFLLWTQPTLQFQIPQNPVLCGVEMWIQGGELDLFLLTTPCSIVAGTLNADFTDGYKLSVQ